MASRYRISYSDRLFVWLLGYSLLLVGMVVLFQYNREKAFKAEELNARLQQVNLDILDDIAEGKPMSEIRGAQDVKGLRVSVISPKGRVIYDNTLDKLPTTNHSSRKEIAEALATGTGYTVRRHSESTGETYFYSARRGEKGEVVRTAVPYSTDISKLLEADYTFLWVLSGLTLVMCVVGFFATRRMGQHIKRLKDFAANAERGEKIYDMEPFAHDELGDISNNIVRLYASLQKAQAERDREHQAALSEQREMEAVKKRLTNNINHELKTPVASIGLCLETLMDHPDLPDAKRQEFLERSLANCTRLTSLLRDVAMITRMDDGGESISTEEVNLTGIIAGVCDNFRPQAETAGFSIVNDVVRRHRVTGNASLLESIFSNLISNAINYSGGSRISIYEIPVASREEIILHVADNGTGVDPKHLPRLFERFYRVDKGRSRAAGGTGLGLSIVKNAVKFHNGTITVANLPSGGLDFTLKFTFS